MTAKILGGEGNTKKKFILILGEFRRSGEPRIPEKKFLSIK